MVVLSDINPVPRLYGTFICFGVSGVEYVCPCCSKVRPGDHPAYLDIVIYLFRILVEVTSESLRCKEMQLTDYLQRIGKPIAYYPGLVPLTGSVTATIFLCQMLYWKGEEQTPDGWINKTQREMSEETGLSRCEQESSRRLLKELGFLEEKYAGCPRKLYYRLNMDRINAFFSGIFFSNQHNAENQQTSVRRSADKIVGAEQPEGILLENQHNAENQQTSTLETDKPGEFSLKNTSLLKTSKQEGGKQADKIVESGQHEAIPVEKRHIAESRQAGGAAKLLNTKTSINTKSLNTFAFAENGGEEKTNAKVKAKAKEKQTDPEIRRLVDWYYGLWENSPPEELNGNGGGRIAKIFSELLKSLCGRRDLKDPEDYIRWLYLYYRETSPSVRKVDWIFGDEVKSLTKFRSKFADVEAFWRKNTSQAVKPAAKNFGVPDHILERNKLPFLEVN